LYSMFHSCYYSKCCTQTMPSCIFMAASSPLSRSTHQTGSPSVCHRRVKWHVYLHRLKKVGRRACHTRASSYCCDATASPYGYTYYCVCEAYDLVSRQHRPATGGSTHGECRDVQQLRVCRPLVVPLGLVAPFINSAERNR
jgi:hypothetical protein